MYAALSVPTKWGDKVNESILDTIKKLLGADPGYHPFDADLVLHINSYIGAINQFGVGVPNFAIEGADETWSDFLGDNEALYNIAKSYLYAKVKLIFDPPTSSALMQALTESANELEWRLIEKADIQNKEDKE